VASKIAPIILITTPLPRTEPILYPCRRVFKCKTCHRQFSATSGNLLACRKLPFRTLFTGIPQIAADFSLISSQTGVSDKRESLKLSRSWKFVRLGRHCQRYSVCRSGNMPYRALGLIVSITGLAALALSLPKPAHAVDPQSHCAKVGKDDTVRTIPPNLIAIAETLFHEPANEAASHRDMRDMYVYRCMGGSVWVCNHGANIPCAKGDTRRVLPSVTDYCNENPNQDFVPMVVTGHGTIHSWECVGGRARIKESEEVDRRGFIANQWQLLQ
jgi:hypothetical protein